ncbi:hypothetical protein ACW2Q0_21015 [Nocardia sp. R16R-3T]
MTGTHTAVEIADHYAPVFAILDRWAACGEVDPDPVPVTLGDGSPASMTRDWLTFPRAEGAISGKSLSLTMLRQWRSAR